MQYFFLLVYFFNYHFVVLEVYSKLYLWCLGKKQNLRFQLTKKLESKEVFGKTRNMEKRSPSFIPAETDPNTKFT